MATYSKNGLRKHQLNNRKEALKQLSNFGNIMESMKTLDLALDAYEGKITKGTLDSIAMMINLEKKLNLNEKQISMVTKKYE